MRAKIWGVIVFLLTVAVAATPASGSEAYVATASNYGDAVYMAPDENGSFSGPEDLLVTEYSGMDETWANGIGDFDGDGDLDYIMAVGFFPATSVFVIPKTGPGNQFDVPVPVGEFSNGFYPRGLTVADFNDDKMLDFVVISYRSADCTLFLNRGGGEANVFQFEPVSLPNTAATYSYGIDAADFNNDGMTDFIVASYISFYPFKVNLWIGNDENGVPIFDSHEFFPNSPLGDKNSGFGIAAADFIAEDENGNPDPNADLAVSNYNSLDIYKGDGLGSFTFFASYPLPVGNSPLDNGDFDRDGIQDLIVGNFGSSTANLVVLFGDGTGAFSYSDTDDIYTRSDLSARVAVTGLPFANSNKAPVALLIPEVINVTVGETVELDGSESYDEDGTIVSYEWDFGEGAVAPMGINTMAVDGTGADSAEPQSSHVYFDSGTYYVTLTVTDDRGASASVQAEVEVNPLAVDVRFSPRRLDLKSKGKWITATIRLPRGYNAGMVDTSGVFLVVEGKTWIQAKSDNRHRYSKKHHKKYRRKRKLKVKFDRQALIQALNGATGEAGLTVMGDISIDVSNLGHVASNVANAKTEFSGTGTIKAFEKKKGSFKKEHRQQIKRFFPKGRSKHHR